MILNFPANQNKRVEYDVDHLDFTENQIRMVYGAIDQFGAEYVAGILAHLIHECVLKVNDDEFTRCVLQDLINRMNKI